VQYRFPAQCRSSLQDSSDETISTDESEQGRRLDIYCSILSVFSRELQLKYWLSPALLVVTPCYRDLSPSLILIFVDRKNPCNNCGYHTYCMISVLFLYDLQLRILEVLFWLLLDFDLRSLPWLRDPDC